jgi:hypothetical protein
VSFALPALSLLPAGRQSGTSGVSFALPALSLLPSGKAEWNEWGVFCVACTVALAKREGSEE